MNRTTDFKDSGFPYSIGLKAVDAPGVGVDFMGFTQPYKHISCDDTYTMYLMYKPKGEGTIAVPIQSLQWSWKAEAEHISSNAGVPTVWKLVAESAIINNGRPFEPIDAVDYTSFPEWHHLRQALPFK